MGNEALAGGAVCRARTPGDRRRLPGGGAGERCRSRARQGDRRAGAGDRGPVRQARSPRAGRVRRPLRRLRRERQRADAHGARARRADAGVLRIDRSGHVRLRRALRALRGRRMLALLLLRKAALPAGTLPLHARSRRGAGVACAVAAPPRRAARRPPRLMDWPRSALLLVSSSSRTGPVEGFISLARELRARGVDARFGGDTVRPGENLGEHLALAGVPWETGLRLSRKVRPADLLHDAGSLTRWAREGRFDVLQAGFAHDHHLSLWAAARAKRPDLRVVRAAQRRIDVEPGALRLRLRAVARPIGLPTGGFGFVKEQTELVASTSRRWCAGNPWWQTAGARAVSWSGTGWMGA